ncbi:YoaK family protein [Streptomyces sp. NPDC002133]|uniref:YoaK family protein n=1 Tax=Streptomyces sp. NPDC002133 TaxID=3154409 RepID=UPI0033341E18
MRKLLTDAVHTLVPPREDPHGPLPPLMLTLTVVTGLVDAVSYLGLGHVFVANMTGNVVFLGFALAGAQGLSAPASVTALGAFLGGALAGGRLHAQLGTHRGRLLTLALGAQVLLVAVTVVVAAATDDKVTSGVQYVLIVLLAMGMGVQNAVVRRLGVADLTTTVLTLTLTGLAADSRAAGGTGPRPGRRVLSVVAMFLGALIGGLLLLHVGPSTALGLALLLLVATAAFTHRLSASDAAWTRPPTS